MSFARALKKLDRLYATMPGIECKGLCWGSCGPIGMSKAEHDRLVQINDTPRQDLTCPLLTASKQCSAYEARPVLCRLFGVAEEMPCPFGCKPERVVQRTEGYGYLEAARRIGGESTSL